ncbi:unnamed protein product [Aphanomyces euteiches]
MPGTVRRDIQRTLLQASTWCCLLCEWHNLTSSTTCSVCKSPKDTAHRLSTWAKPVSAIKSLMFRAAEQIVMYDDSHLNATQLSAKMRRQWTREIVKGKLMWKRHFIRAACEAFTLRKIFSQDGLHDIEWTPLDHRGYMESVWSAGLAVSSIYNTEVAHSAFPVKCLWVLEQVAATIVPYSALHLKVKTHRHAIFNQAMDMLLALDTSTARAIIRVEIHGEAAQDAGAVLREWYTVVAENILNESNGLFMISNREDQTYFINPNSAHAWHRKSNHTGAFRAVGRFIGRAILDGQVLPLHFNPVIFKAILGVPMSLDDIELLDPAMFQSLLYLLKHDGVDELGLTFSVTEPRGDSYTEIDLIYSGRDIAVTDGNKDEYVQRMVHHLLFGRVEAQMNALIRGVYDILSPTVLLVLDHKELEILLCGYSEIDLNDWRENTIVLESTSPDASSVIDWFWQIVDELSPTNRIKLLQFSTGSSRVPVQGFKGLTSYDGYVCYFTLKCVEYKEGAFPTAHTCYNRLDLPTYPNKQLLHDAISSLLLCDPTGFTLA